jgi:hypothetical protein
MFCAQVKPESAVPSSQAVLQLSPVDHSVSQTGLVQPDSGEFGLDYS